MNHHGSKNTPGRQKGKQIRQTSSAQRAAAAEHHQHGHLPVTGQPSTGRGATTGRVDGGWISSGARSFRLLSTVLRCRLERGSTSHFAYDLRHEDRLLLGDVVERDAARRRVTVTPEAKPPLASLHAGITHAALGMISHLLRFPWLRPSPPRDGVGVLDSTERPLFIAIGSYPKREAAQAASAHTKPPPEDNLARAWLTAA
jgi:hypothetical protein